MAALGYDFTHFQTLCAYTDSDFFANLSFSDFVSMLIQTFVLTIIFMNLHQSVV